MTAYDDLRDLARDVALTAGALVRQMRADGMDVAATKSSPTDVVTAADQASERLLRERLLDARPQDGFLGEEGDAVEGSSGVTWVVDPIDGTVNYLYGDPQYAVSVAARVDGRSVAGAVFQPPTGALFTATLGGGAWLGERRLAVRPVVPAAQALVHTGFGYEAHVRARQAAAVAELLPRVRDIRRPGSCALDLCALAAGWCDAYVEEGPHLWDHAAAGLVATEAGARVEVLDPGTGLDLVMATPEGSFSAFRDLCEACGFVGDGAGNTSG
ncbi:inositol monophosphatase [Marmoricola endophyticus]|uniref:Inositol-1-monophosphatase n=1 Tax=Marmoricola endophyticus TaxID=2040280 RepID=A0A917B9C6_9ACTN|nr:inositol monophosphatase family protein [Marmoricola endophyticus]GGF32721.1 inositol monophosphatase [Marmoricola endophyticus]